MRRWAAVVVGMGMGFAGSAGAGTEVVTETRKPDGETSPGHALFATEDQAEGMAAFLEKRQAQFRDK